MTARTELGGAAHTEARRAYDIALDYARIAVSGRRPEDPTALAQVYATLCLAEVVDELRLEAARLRRELLAIGSAVIEERGR